MQPQQVQLEALERTIASTIHARSARPHPRVQPLRNRSLRRGRVLLRQRMGRQVRRMGHQAQTLRVHTMKRLQPPTANKPSSSVASRGAPARS